MIGKVVAEQQNANNELGPSYKDHQLESLPLELLICRVESFKEPIVAVLSNENSYEGLEPLSSSSLYKDCDDQASIQGDIYKLQKKETGLFQIVPLSGGQTSRLRKYSYKASASEISLEQYNLEKVENSKICDFNETDSLFSGLLFENSFQTINSITEHKTVVHKIPQQLNNAKSEEAKNFLKFFGDLYSRYLIREKIIQESFFEDSLSSRNIWNSFLNGGFRKEYTGKQNKAFFNKVDKLSNKKNWISHFVKFASTFDATEIRNSKAIKSQERKLHYELIARSLKAAVNSIVQTHCSVFGERPPTISLFIFDTVNKNEIIIHFAQGVRPPEPYITHILSKIQKNAPKLKKKGLNSRKLSSESCMIEEEEKTDQAVILSQNQEGADYFEKAEIVDWIDDLRFALFNSTDMRSNSVNKSHKNYEGFFVLPSSEELREAWLDVDARIANYDQEYSTNLQEQLNAETQFEVGSLLDWISKL